MVTIKLCESFATDPSGAVRRRAIRIVRGEPEDRTHHVGMWFTHGSACRIRKAGIGEKRASSFWIGARPCSAKEESLAVRVFEQGAVRTSIVFARLLSSNSKKRMLVSDRFEVEDRGVEAS